MFRNSRIAKNTLYLYIRMFITMSISLYTSRLFLQILGVEDFGIYNLVGGVVVLFTFLNNAMSGASQRYLNIEVAANVDERISKVFSMSVNIHIIVAGVVFILFETVGLWILNSSLNIPPGRMFAANLVYQCSILTAVLEIIKVPLNASILVHERMSFYAVMSVIETVLRGGIIFCLPFWPHFFDPLVLYSILLLLMSGVSATVLWVFCKRTFGARVRYRFERDVGLFRQFLSFSSWSMMGQVATLSTTQGLNFLLNNFFGVVVNAALGIAGQISGAIYNFVSNVQVALNPQIVQTLARDEKATHVKLVLQGSRFSFFILCLISVPFLVGTKYILTLWLGVVPEYAVGITKLVILNSLISALAGPLWMSVYALGNIKRYQILLSLLFISQLPIYYVLLRAGYNPHELLGAKLLMESMILIFRVYFFKTSLGVRGTAIFNYIKKILPVFLLPIGITLVSQKVVFNDIWHLMTYAVAAELIIAGLVIFWGIEKDERRFIVHLIRAKLARI